MWPLKTEMVRKGVKRVLSLCFTLRFPSRSILSQKLWFPRWEEANLPFIIAWVATGGKVETEEIQGTVQGTSSACMTGRCVLKAKEGHRKREKVVCVYSLSSAGHQASLFPRE